MKKSDNERIKKIIDIWSSLQLQIKEHSITKENLLNDEFLQWAVTTPLYNIGEQVYKISDDTKKQYPDIIWSIVAGLRPTRLFFYSIICFIELTKSSISSNITSTIIDQLIPS